MKKYQRLWQQLQSYQNVILVPHRYPDGDALGAAFGLYGMLTTMSAKVKVRIIGNHIDGSEWMGSFDVIPDDHWANSDVLLLDTATKELVYTPQALSAQSRMLIDHHPKTTPFYDDAFIDTTATSTCEIIAAMASEESLAISSHSAQCLLYGLLHDTTVLTHPYTSTKTFDVVAYLIERGANYHAIQKKVLSYPFQTLTTIRQWMERLTITPRGFGYLYVTYEELANVHFPFSELFRQCRQIEEITMICLVVHKEPQYIMHFQSDKENLNQLLAPFGGGGHAFAAKVYVDSLPETYRIIEAIDQRQG